MEVKTVGIACDHAGFPLKQFVLEYLEKKGYPVKDYGTYSDASVDYPDFGHALAKGIESGEVYPGIGICGSGAAGGAQGTARLTGQTAGAVLMTLILATLSLEAAPVLGLGLAAALTLTAGLISLLRAKSAGGADISS